jgi:CheY-like chemotaxis protein
VTKGARILVADDDPASLELITYALRAEGYEVSNANDGNLALGLGTTGDFDLVILDVHMPMYDGVEVLQLLRKRHIIHPIKVIALTADSSDETRAALEANRIDSFFVKPVDLTSLRQEVSRLTAGHAAP